MLLPWIIFEMASIYELMEKSKSPVKHQKEEVYHMQYKDYLVAKIAMFQFIEGWYNRNRIYSSLRYQTPQAIEVQIRKTA